jgi:hypothetical protein
MYIMSITNFFGVECWNSYSNAYPRQVTIMARIKMAMNLTSDATGYSWPPPSTPNSFITTTITTINPWPAYNNNMGLSSFVLPFGTNALVLWLPDSVYNYGPNTAAGFTPPGFIADSNNPPNYLNLGTPPLSHFGLLTTNRLQVVMLDGNNVIDYVQLNGMDSSRDLNAEIADPDDYGLWSTSLTNGAPQGVINQYYTSSRGGTVPKEDSDDGFQWNPVPGLPATKDAEQYYFSLFMTPNGTTGTYFDPNTRRTYSVVITATNVQVPYTPTRTRVQRLTWQANDPLVHYLASDLTDTADDTNAQHVIDWPYNLGFLNTRYMPWSGNPVTPINPSAPDFNTVNAWNLAVKDPLVSSSDNWDFPTYKFPTVGWLGRVHRGTPWQTVYLKASPTDTTNWMTWTGNENLFDATNAAPGQDRLLFDLFTTAFNDNATRGTLSVNQGAGSSDPAAGLAAWSAVFSGVLVLSNNASDAALTTFPPPMTPPFTAFPIDPAGSAGLASAVGQLVQGINQTRANNNLQSFTHMGDILSVPQLTEQSPFLNWKNDIVQQQNGISDEMYEWLPQQVMSLMRASSSPRYVIYCYGQALKPAPESVYNSSGAYFGMITNYQVVSEIATRAVVRFDSMVTNVITYSVIFTNSVEFPGGFYVTNWYTVPVMKNNNAVIESFNLLPPD